MLLFPHALDFCSPGVLFGLVFVFLSLVGQVDKKILECTYSFHVDVMVSVCVFFSDKHWFSLVFT